MKYAEYIEQMVDLGYLDDASLVLSYQANVNHLNAIMLYPEIPALAKNKRRAQVISESIKRVLEKQGKLELLTGLHLCDLKVIKKG